MNKQIELASKRFDEILNTYENILRKNCDFFCEIFVKINNSEDVKKLSAPEYFYLAAILEIFGFIKNTGDLIKHNKPDYVKNEWMKLADVLLKRAEEIGLLKFK
jgi:hypothetical protein